MSFALMRDMSAERDSLKRTSLRILRRLCCHVVVLLSFTIDSYGATIIATDTSATAVQAAINSATDGDKVIVPAGTATWSATVSFNKGITLQGAGIGQTIIINGNGYATPVLDASGAMITKRFTIT